METSCFYETLVLMYAHQSTGHNSTQYCNILFSLRSTSTPIWGSRVWS